MAERKYRKYSTEEKERLATLVEEYKVKYEKEREENVKNLVWDRRRKRFVTKSTEVTKEGYLAKAVRDMFPSLKDLKSGDAEFERAVKVAKRAMENRERKRKAGENVDVETGSKKRFREAGGGRKAQAVEVRQALFDWFVDVRGALKGRLPMKVFKAKCEELYQDWLQQEERPKEEDQQLKFTKPWISGWMREYNVSLLKPNKRYQIAKEDRVERITELIKNVLRVRYFFVYHYKKEPDVINGDQMPLHRNECAGQKTLSLKNQDVFVKENYMLSRERSTVYTQVSTGQDVKPEMLFKGKGVRMKVCPPEGMNVQFAPKGSYRLENMLKMVSTLKNRYNMFSCKDNAVYILDDYTVHTMHELKDAFLKRGYILIIIGGGVTGDVQVNDTHVHHRLKANYRELESKLMLEKLRMAPNKIPAPSRDEMIEMILTSWQKTMENVNPLKALKENFLCNALDGSEDYLVRDKLFQLVGESIKEFRKQLMSSPPPKTLQELLKTLTPPKGVHTKTPASAPLDEGRELLDCEGEEIEEGMEDVLVDSSDEEGGKDNRTVPSQVAVIRPASKETPHVPTIPTDTADEAINKDARMVNELSSLMEKYTGQISVQFLPYFCQLTDTVQKARRSLKKRVHQSAMQATSSQKDQEIQMGEQNAPQNTSTASTSHDPVTEPASPLSVSDSFETDSDSDEDFKGVLSPGNYVKIQSHGHSVPACIVSVEPLSVCYFVTASNGMFQAGDTLFCQRKDIVSLIDEPEIVCFGTRTVLYKFHHTF